MARSASQEPRVKKKNSSRRAVFILFALFLCAFLLAYGRIFFFQIVQGKELSQAAENQRMRQIETPAKRGTIYDREGEPLAVSVQAYNIIADPTLVSRPRQSAQVIASVIGGDENEYYKKLCKRGKSRYSIVAKKVDAPKIEQLKKKIDEIELPDTDASNYKAEKNYKDGLRALSYEICYKRTYPSGTTASQVLGFINTEDKGSAGLELYYNDLLAGEPGLSFSERDIHGNKIPSGIQTTIEPKDGNDIILTIDKDIQYYAEAQIRKAVKTYKAAAGSVIVMNPKNGELYAACSYPTYDPNNYGKAKAENIKNRALTDLYEPGSTMKTVTVSGALDQGAVTPTTKFNVSASMRIGSHTVKDSHGHATQRMTTSQIIEQSSNTGTTKIARKMGKRGLYSTLVNYGFNAKPGVDFPGCSKGWLPNWKDWADISLSNFSFGQGVSATPVQMARAVSAIGNDGVLNTPHLLKDVPSDPESIEEWPSSNAVSAKAAQETLTMMKKVMTKGTGKAIKVEGYKVAGKTGTAQKAIPGKGYVAGKYVGSFIGMVPADDPQLTVLVVLDEPKAGYYGGTVAGGAFASISRYSAQHLNIAPTTGVEKVTE